MALGAVHFEFLPVSELDAPRPRCVHMSELRDGESYEIVISNHAGLYRYRLGDVVRIVGFEGKTPVFEFEYRRGNVLDLVGEKTTEQHLRNAFARLVDESPGLESVLTEFHPVRGHQPGAVPLYRLRGTRRAFTAGRYGCNGRTS